MKAQRLRHISLDGFKTTAITASMICGNVMRKIFRVLSRVLSPTSKALLGALAYLSVCIQGLFEDYPEETYEEYEKRLREAIFKEDL